MIFRNFIDIIISGIASLIETRNFFQHTPYLLEEINTETEQIVIHCRGSRTYIKTTIEGAIITPNIVEGLPAMQACWLGYYYAYPPQKDTPNKNS